MQKNDQLTMMVDDLIKKQMSFFLLHYDYSQLAPSIKPLHGKISSPLIAAKPTLKRQKTLNMIQTGLRGASLMLGTTNSGRGQ